MELKYALPNVLTAALDYLLIELYGIEILLLPLRKSEGIGLLIELYGIEI